MLAMEFFGNISHLQSLQTNGTSGKTHVSMNMKLAKASQNFHRRTSGGRNPFTFPLCRQACESRTPKGKDHRKPAKSSEEHSEEDPHTIEWTHWALAISYSS